MAIMEGLMAPFDAGSSRQDGITNGEKAIAHCPTVPLMELSQMWCWRHLIRLSWGDVHVKATAIKTSQNFMVSMANLSLSPIISGAMHQGGLILYLEFCPNQTISDLKMGRCMYYSIVMVRLSFRLRCPPALHMGSYVCPTLETY